MSDNYDIERERERVKKEIEEVLKEKEKKRSIKNIKIINITIIDKKKISDQTKNN